MAASTTFTLFKPYSVVTVTVPNDSAIHQLYALTKAVDPQAAIKGNYVCVINDPILSTSTVRIGEGPTNDLGEANPAVVSATNGLPLTTGNSETFGGWTDEYSPLQRHWVQNLGEGTGVVVLTVQVIRS